MKKRKNAHQLNSKPKRVVRSFAEEFLTSSSQTHDLRLPQQKSKSLFSLPHTFKGRAIDFLKLMITTSFVQLLFSKNFLAQLSISTSLDQFWTFMAVWISMGLIRLSNIKKHFERNKYWMNIVAMTFMSRNSFMKVLRSMNGDYKELMKLLQLNIHTVYKPAVKGSIDETILAFTGKSSIKVYLPAKPHPNGIKLFTYVDKHGILYSLIMYEKKSIPVSDIFSRLLGDYKNRVIKIYADRWFGSRKATEFCSKHGLKFVIAMPKNRGKKLWQELRLEAESIGYAERKWKKDESVRAVAVKVGHIVCNFMINHRDFTTPTEPEPIGSKTISSIQKYYTSLVDDYNENMKKVDQFNQAYYLHLPVIRQNNVPCSIRRALLRIAVVNAYHMYELYHGIKIRQDKFLEMLMFQLLGFTEEGWIEFMNGHLFLSTKTTQTCGLCPNRHNPSSCTHRCAKCNKSMCLSCFLMEHMTISKNLCFCSKCCY